MMIYFHSVVIKIHTVISEIHNILLTACPSYAANYYIFMFFRICI